VCGRDTDEVMALGCWALADDDDDEDEVNSSMNLLMALVFEGEGDAEEGEAEVTFGSPLSLPTPLAAPVVGELLLLLVLLVLLLGDKDDDDIQALPDLFRLSIGVFALFLII